MAKATKIQEHYIAWFCPGCQEDHGVPVEGHDSGRGWKWNGSVEAPDLNPSVLINVGRSNPAHHLCHFFIRNGQIQFLTDCTHALAGKTVPMEEWE